MINTSMSSCRITASLLDLIMTASKDIGIFMALVAFCAEGACTQAYLQTN